MELVHAYVDGLWLKRRQETPHEHLDSLLEEIRARTGLPIALDGVYRWVVFLTSRVNPRRPVANRYFGVFENGEIKVRGIAARRKDTPAWVADVQMEVLEVLAGAAQPEAGAPAAWQHALRRLAELRAGQVALERLLVSQRISRELEEYRTPSPAARAARQLKEVGKVIKPGQRVRFLFTLGDPGVLAWDLPAWPDPRAIDLARYRELLLRAVEEVLSPFMEEEKTLFSQLSLPGVKARLNVQNSVPANTQPA